MLNSNLPGEPYDYDEDIGLFQFLVKMNQNLMTQARSSSLNTAQILITVQNMQADLKELIRVMDLTRERRFEEEISALEHQIGLLKSQIDEKKNAKVELKSTADHIRNGIRAEMEAQAKKKSVDWTAARQTAVNASVGALAVAIVWSIISRLPEIGTAITKFFER